MFSFPTVIVFYFAISKNILTKYTFQVKAVAHLRELHLCRVDLSTEQLVALFEMIAASGKFQEVNLSAMDLSQVEYTPDKTSCICFVRKLFETMSILIPKVKC